MFNSVDLIINVNIKGHIRKQTIEVDSWKMSGTSITDWKQTKERASKKSADEFLRSKQHRQRQLIMKKKYCSIQYQIASYTPIPG